MTGVCSEKRLKLVQRVVIGDNVYVRMLRWTVEAVALPSLYIFTISTRDDRIS